MSAKRYFHVFASKTKKDERTVWFHEASRDTRFDARDDMDDLKRDGYRVRVIYSDNDPMVLLNGPFGLNKVTA